jgi:glycosyltransferase involved in cell wall biosynthesis
MNATRQLVEIVVPVHNEEAVLEPNGRLLLDYLRTKYPFRFSIVVADNASTDGTPAIASGLAEAEPEVGFLRLERKGRGHALRIAWLASAADVVSYMDVDLSTNLASFLPLVAPLLSGHSEIAIGTRLAHSSHVRRRVKREVLSRGYNLLVRLGFRAGFSDAQCGFKALRHDAVQRLLPHVRDDGWFFDTELLLLAERNGMRIHEVPVEWVEDLDSRVDVVPTISGDLAGFGGCAARVLGRDMSVGSRELTHERRRRLSRRRERALSAALAHELSPARQRFRRIAVRWHHLALAAMLALAASLDFVGLTEPVAAMGGFTGGETVLTNAYLARLVRSGQARYFLLGGRGGFGPGGGSNAAASTIESACRQVSTSSGGTLYDCAGRADAIASTQN